MISTYRHQLIKLVAIDRGTVNAVEGHDDWILYKIYHPDLGRIIYDDDDEEITMKKGELLTADQLKILDEYLIAQSREIVDYLDL